MYKSLLNYLENPKKMHWLLMTMTDVEFITIWLLNSQLEGRVQWHISRHLYMSVNTSFKHQRQERQRQRHKLRIWLVECGQTIVLHVRHAVMNKSVSSSAKQQREFTTFTVLMSTWAYNRKSLVLCIYFDSAQTNPVAGFFVNIVKCEHDGIIGK